MAQGTSERHRKPAVLLVEDYVDTREALSEFLVSSGYRVVQAEDGAQALRAVAERVPDLVLLDLTLPGIDGWEVARRMRRDARTRGVPILAMTGLSQRSVFESAAQAGIDGVLVKPCAPESLLAEAERLLRTGRRRPEAELALVGARSARGPGRPSR